MSGDFSSPPHPGSAPPHDPDHLYASPRPGISAGPQPAFFTLTSAGAIREEITAAITGGWRTDSIEAATIDITTAPGGTQAWLTALTRI